MAKLTVNHIELGQAIQNVNNDVPLIAGKPTWVRVYLDTSGVSQQAELVGELTIEIAGSTYKLIYRAQSSPTRLRQLESLRDQRLDWSASLNFKLPDALLRQAAGKKIVVSFASASVVESNGDRIGVTELSGKQNVEVDVCESPGMHCRILLFRHRDRVNLDHVFPARGDAEAIKRYVENTFPVAEVSWSSVELAAPRNFRALEPVARESRRTQEQLTRSYMSFFQHMLAIREQDIADGRNVDTLYLGLIEDPSGRFGGAAMDSPQFAAPHIVSMATADMEGQLGAHEIAHVLGRRHPGIPDCKRHNYVIGQHEEPGARKDISGKHPINLRGYLSNGADEQSGDTHLGLDYRFNRESPDLLAHDQYFDLMTYRYPKWISDFSYVGLQDRLEEIQRSRFTLDSGEAIAGRVWTVIGQYDLKRKAGKIFQVIEGCYKTPMPDLDAKGLTVSEISALNRQTSVVKLTWGSDSRASECVYVRDFKHLDGSDSYGVFQHTIGLKGESLDRFRKLAGKTIDDSSREDFYNSFRTLVLDSGRLRLVVNGVVADEIQAVKESRSERIEEYLKEIVQPSGTHRKENPAMDPGEFFLQYSVDEGGYYLGYRWELDEVIEDHHQLLVVTSIACQRRRHLQLDGQPDSKDDALWETISVNHRKRDRVWISPVFFDHPNADANGSDGDDTEHSKYGPYFFGGAAIKQQSLSVKVTISVGMQSVSRIVELGLPENQRLALAQRRSAETGHRDSPGSAEETSRPLRWYRQRF